MDSPYDQKPLLVQSDHSLLLEVHHPACEACRADIAPFTELEKSPEHIHTYRMSPLTLWNAASAGLTGAQILGILDQRSRYPVPDNVRFFVNDMLGRWGLFQLDATDDPDTLVLRVADERLRRELGSQRKLAGLVRPRGDEFLLPLLHRGTLKKEMLTLGYPVQDLAPLKDGDPLEVSLRAVTGGGTPLTIRDYQKGAADGVLGRGQPGTGFGTIVLPCGSGKTVVGLEILTRLATNTLVLTTNVAAVHQWIDEILDKTTLTADEIGEYTGDKKLIKAVTVATYQVLVWRDDRDGEYPHFRLFRDENWGLIIYDEVHLLPAPVFRVTAELQALRRVGLTATLVREDGAEGDVFSLVGPKRYDVPWKEMEAKGWIAQAKCTEIRLELPEDLRIPYAVANKREKFRIASENPLKEDVVVQARPEPPRRRHPRHWPVPRPAPAAGQGPEGPPDHRVDPRPRPGGPVRRLPVGEDPGGGGVEGGQLRHRPPRRQHGHPGVRNLRQPPGRGPAPGPDPQAQAAQRPVLHHRQPGHQRRRVLGPPPEVSDRTGVQVHHRGVLRHPTEAARRKNRLQEASL